MINFKLIKKFKLTTIVELEGKSYRYLGEMQILNTNKKQAYSSWQFYKDDGLIVGKSENYCFQPVVDDELTIITMALQNI